MILNSYYSMYIPEVYKVLQTLRINDMRKLDYTASYLRDDFWYIVMNIRYYLEYKSIKDTGRYHSYSAFNRDTYHMVLAHKSGDIISLGSHPYDTGILSYGKCCCIKEFIRCIEKQGLSYLERSVKSFIARAA